MKNKFLLGMAISILEIFHCNVSIKNPGFTRKWPLDTSWIVSPIQAVQLSNQGGIWIDARSFVLFEKTLPGNTKSLSWKEFSSGLPSGAGNLKQKELILEILKSRDIDIQKSLLVLGDARNGWGEEGRIVWMLRTLGISNSFLVDGGMSSVETILEKSIPVDSLDEYPEWKENPSSTTISSQELVSIKSDKDVFLLDTREKREYDGATPYGEKRGGHIPEAKWLYYKDLLDKEGFILSKEEIEKMLKELGYKENQTIVSYCTGGVRSAFVTAILISYGFSAKNYAGSMWEYSSMNPEDGFILE